jgi:hypothetical protein
MKMNPHPALSRRAGEGARTSGSAVIVVLVLLFLMTALLAVNSMALHRFKQSLQSIEHRELKRLKLKAES